MAAGRRAVERACVAGRHKTIDRLRRRVAYREKQRALAIEAAIAGEAAPIDRDDVLDDDMLRLIFTCCHPALNLETQVALTLRAVCGLSTTAVARAFLVAEDTMAQRLVRAKTKIRVARIPYQTPDADQLGERIEGVLAVVYQVFTEGYAPTTGGDLTRADLCGEAIRLGRLLRQLMPQRAAIAGLLALMLLHDARRDARASAEGDLIQLEFQDRGRWNRDQIGEGAALVNAALRAPGIPSAYAVQAAIAALHAQADSFAATDWRQIVGLYDTLMRVAPSPVVALNRAVAIGQRDGAEAGLAAVEAAMAGGGLDTYHLAFAAAAGLHRQCGRIATAIALYRQGLDLAVQSADRRFLERRMAELPDVVRRMPDPGRH